MLLGEYMLMTKEKIYFWHFNSYILNALFYKNARTISSAKLQICRYCTSDDHIPNYIFYLYRHKEIKLTWGTSSRITVVFLLAQ